LIVASFWWYATLTEYLAYEQTATPARLLETPIIAKKHEGLFKDQVPKAAEGLRTALAEFQERSEQELPEALRQYRHSLLKPNARLRENQPDDSYETSLLKRFQSEIDLKHSKRPLPAERVIFYYTAIRAAPSCLTANCHPHPAEREA